MGDTRGSVGRFIPACAGNAPSRKPTSIPTAVHPRVCGERMHICAEHPDCGGSSPRVRGTPVPVRAEGAELRFIPACAGNARSSATRTATGTVHPRVCGERDSTSRSDLAAHGSSPRVRGTLTHTEMLLSLAPVHPRVCGERQHRHHASELSPGSSPRVRGTLAAMVKSVVPNRFIPACAGNAPASPCSGKCCPVHPRVCGERAESQRPPRAFIGSSPRVRGTLIDDMADEMEDRFIPACAGNARPRRLPR